MQRGVYAISVAAELAGVHPATLRTWERRGLIAPSRTSGGQRLYSEPDLATLRRLADLLARGVNLEGARLVVALEAEVARLCEELDRREGK